MFEGLLPQTIMEQEFYQSNAENQPLNHYDVGPHDVEEVVREEESKIRKERAPPKWVQSTLWDSRLVAPLPCCTRAGTSYGRDDDVHTTYVGSLCDVEEPYSFEDAQECEHWKDAMQQEMDSIHKNGTWELVDLPLSKKAFGTKWVYKIKWKPNGYVDRYKARQVAKDMHIKKT